MLERGSIIVRCHRRNPTPISGGLKFPSSPSWVERTTCICDMCRSKSAMVIDIDLETALTMRPSVLRDRILHDLAGFGIELPDKLGIEIRIPHVACASNTSSCGDHPIAANRRLCRSPESPFLGPRHVFRGIQTCPSTLRLGELRYLPRPSVPAPAGALAPLWDASTDHQRRVVRMSGHPLNHSCHLLRCTRKHDPLQCVAMTATTTPCFVPVPVRSEPLRIGIGTASSRCL